MEGKELNKVLKGRAIELGLCEKWQDEWDKEETKQELIEKYLQGIDFCIQHDYPRIEFIKAQFPKPLLYKNGILVDEAVGRRDEMTSHSNVVLLGDSSAELHYDGLISRSVYVRHSSKVTIYAKEGARVFVECYEGSTVNAHSDAESKVFVYWHGGEVETDGNVIVRDKRA